MIGEIDLYAHDKISIHNVVIPPFSNRAYSQSDKNEYLASNRFDMRRCAIPLPDSEVKIIGFGAYHGSAKTETAELIVLKWLIEERRLGYYLPEVDFCLAYYFNEYLLSGDDDLLKSLVLQYGERVPQEKSMECYNKWRSLRKILCENNYRITVIGTAEFNLQMQQNSD